jgi:uncharacterized repeat protein (TIGR01451 family)
MKNYRWLIPIILLALALLVPIDTTGAQGPPYHINQWTYGASSGGTSASASYLLHGTLGQQAVSFSSGLTSTVTGGIWRGASSAAANILVLEKEYRDDASSVQVGDELIFIVAVTNNGDRVQEQVVVTDTIPAGFALVPGSAEADTGAVSVNGDTITLNISELTYEQIAVLTYRVVVEDGTENQTITNTAVAVSTTYGPINQSASVHVFEPYVLYLPVVARHYSPPPTEPEVHYLTDAPDSIPGYAVEIDHHLYHDDFDRENDNDWYAFAAEEGQVYTMQTSDLESNTDTFMVLYDQDGETKLDENDDVDWPNNVASRIVWAAPADGTYYAMVRSYDWLVWGDNTGYIFGVSRGSTTMMESEPSEPDEKPKPLPLPTPTPGPDFSAHHRGAPGHASALPQKPTPPPKPPSPPTPTPAPTSSPSSKPVPSGGFIELCVQFLQALNTPWQELWTVVQWQDDRDSWHDVEGWRGTLDEVEGDEGKKTWWVAKNGFGDGSFRWMLYRSEKTDVLLSRSAPFHLSNTAGETITVEAGD